MIAHLVDPLVYDYSQIADASMRTLAQRSADEIKPRLRRAADDILVIGQRLAVVRQYLPHGQWKSWIETEFGMGDETARQFIRVATRFADKSLIIRDLTPTALYMLAAPSTPDEAIAEVESLVTNGYTPTVAETKQIITTVRAGLAPAPVAPAPGELLTVATAKTNHQIREPLIAAVLRVINDQPDATATILDDLAEGRRGWYHDLILCYTDDTDTETWRAVGRIVQRQLGYTATRAVADAPGSVVPPSDDKNDLSSDPATAADGKPSLAVHFSSANIEHYTPDFVWQAAFKVMGRITLDPCSNSHTQPNIPATYHYTAEDDGLRQFWQGSVFMNPPYGSAIGEWVTKLTEAHSAGDVPEAIALLPARVDTKWWQLIRDYPVCFVTGRLTFKGNDSGAPFPSAIVYLGQRVGVFVREFAPMGDIWRRVQ